MKTDLDPTIQEVATIYNFEIKYEEELEKWVIMDKENSRNYGFYWSSDESKHDFFDELKSFFLSKGEQRYRKW